MPKVECQIQTTPWNRVEVTDSINLECEIPFYIRVMETTRLSHLQEVCLLGSQYHQHRQYGKDRLVYHLYHSHWSKIWPHCFSPFCIAFVLFWFLPALLCFAERLYLFFNISY